MGAYDQAIAAAQRVLTPELAGGEAGLPVLANIRLGQAYLAQGDYRPMAGNSEAMEDLRRILAGRAPYYAKADLAFDTSGHSLEQAFAGLCEALDTALAGEAVAAD